MSRKLASSSYLRISGCIVAIMPSLLTRLAPEGKQVAAAGCCCSDLRLDRQPGFAAAATPGEGVRGVAAKRGYPNAPLGQKVHGVVELSGRRDCSQLLQQVLARRIQAQGRLDPGLTLEDAVMLMWVLTSPHMYEYLVVDGGWSLKRYSGHVVRLLRQAVLT
jgi:hypothetical protein